MVPVKFVCKIHRLYYSIYLFYYVKGCVIMNHYVAEVTCFSCFSRFVLTKNISNLFSLIISIVNSHKIFPNSFHNFSFRKHSRCQMQRGWNYLPTLTICHQKWFREYSNFSTLKIYAKPGWFAKDGRKSLIKAI